MAMAWSYSGMALFKSRAAAAAVAWVKSVSKAFLAGAGEGTVGGVAVEGEAGVAGTASLGLNSLSKNDGIKPLGP